MILFFFAMSALLPPALMLIDFQLSLMPKILLPLPYKMRDALRVIFAMLPP